jgi:hypothetical protein
MSDDETEILHSHKEFKQLQEVITKLKKQLKVIFLNLNSSRMQR